MHSLKELHSQTWSKNGRQRWAIMFSRPFFVALQRLWDLKSDNLQYNTLAQWVDGINDLLTKRLMFQALFFS